MNCRDAAMMSMRRRIAGLGPDQIRALKSEEIEMPVTDTDFQEAINKTSPSVSASDIDRYQKWMDEYGAS